MRGVVFAAGEGTRMRPLTDDRPKGLVEVAGKPLLTHCFETLLGLGVDELLVVVGYRGEQIREYYGERFEGTPITYAEQAERTGLAHAALAAEPHVDGDFLAMNGDNVFGADLAAVRHHHESTDADATLLVDGVSREEATRTGVLELDADGCVTGLVEKPADPPSTTVPRGFYAFSPRIFDACRAVDPAPTGEYELTHAIDTLLDRGGTVETVPLDGWATNVNTPADRETATARLTDGG